MRRGEQARAYLDRALAVFESEGMTRRVARISAVLAEIDHREGHPGEAVARLEAALETLASEEPDEDIAAVAAQLGRFLVLSSRYEDAAPRLELALELAEALGLPEVFAQALTSKSILYTSQNRLSEARILLEGALDLALTNDLHAAAVRAFNNLAVNHESRDRYRDAVDTSNRGLELARHVGDRVWEEIFLYGPISSLVLIGEWDEALARAAAAEGASVESVDALVLFVANVDCARGNLAAARSRLDAQSALRTSDDPQVRMGYASAEAHVLRAEGRFDEALAVAESGIAFRDEVGTTFLNVKLCYVEALESAFALGDGAKVEALLDEIEALRPGARPPLLEAHAQRFRSKLSGDEAGVPGRRRALPRARARARPRLHPARARRGDRFGDAARRGAGDLRAAGRDALARARRGTVVRGSRGMTCASCGTENKPGRKFCSACGATLAVGCPSCGAANEPGDAFCGECGSPLATPRHLRAAARRGARGGAQARLGPLRRSRRLHRLVGEPRRRGHARPALALLRHVPAPDRAATAGRSRSSSATP